MVSDGLWSLRQATGVSYLLVEVDVSYDQTKASVIEAKGPVKSDPSAWSCRQPRHLVAAFREAGGALEVREVLALTNANGMTWRHDKAPAELRGPYEERQRRAREEWERRLAEHEAATRRLRESRQRANRDRIVVYEEMDQMPSRPARVRDWTELPSVREWAANRLSQGLADPYAYIFGTPQDRGGVISFGCDTQRIEVSGVVGFDSYIPSVTRPLAHELERIRERHARPKPTVQARLMSGFAQTSITLTPKPRAREPPAVAASTFGTFITVEDVRRARRYAPGARAFVTGLRDTLMGRRSRT